MTAKKSSKADSSPTHAAPIDEDHSAGSGSYQVVARRYRPKTFEELAGQSHIAQALSNALTTGRIGHAYLFTGVRGVGKTSTARIFAKCLNCLNSADGPTVQPCGVCDSCVNISLGEDIDALEIDGASNRGIDEIRQLRQNASICPSRSRFKIYIIDEVHMLTVDAFNALLKILEEPPKHVKFIFCTTNPTKLPVTILSRCQRFDFAGIDLATLAGRLSEIASNEGVTADDGVFELLGRRAMGSMRDAQSLLEQLLSFAPEHITAADVHEMLGTADEQLLLRLIDAMLQCQPAVIFMELDQAAAHGVDFGFLVEQLMGFFRDLMVTASGGDASLLVSCSPSQFDRLRDLSEAFGLHRILASLQILDQLAFRLGNSTQSRVLTELAMIRIAHLDHFQMVSVLLDKLREGTLPIALPTVPSTPVRQVHKAIPSPTAPAVPTPRSSESEKSPQKDSPLPQTADLDTMNSEQADRIWHDVVDSIPGMLGQYAGSCTRVEFEKPNIFVAVFSRGVVKDRCAKESPILQNALSQRIGKAVRVRIVLEESGEKSAPTGPESKPAVSSADRRNLLQDAMQNEFVKEIVDVFRAEIRDLDYR